MKLGRSWTLVAAGLLGASLLLSPLAHADEGAQGSTTTGTHKTATKSTKAKKHTTTKKGTTTTPSAPQKTE